MALSGGARRRGGAFRWRYPADQVLGDGRLVRVWPGVTNRQVADYLQYRENRSNDARIREVVDCFESITIRAEATAAITR